MLTQKPLHNLRYWLINLLLILTAVSLAYGLVMPLITLNQLIMFSNTFSVISGVKSLWLQQQYLLFSIILLFSVVLPSLKLVLLFVNWNFPPAQLAWRERLLNLSMLVGRWSMVDVLAVAVFVVLMKVNIISRVQTHPGLIVFTLAVIVLMLLTTYISHALKDKSHQK